MNFDDIDDSKRALIERLLDRPITGATPAVWGFTNRTDFVTLANPFGPPARGWDEVAKTQERGASYYRDGEIYDFETVAKYVTSELACKAATIASCM